MQPTTTSENLAVDSRQLEPLACRIRDGQQSASFHWPAASSDSDDDRPYRLVNDVAILPLRGYLAKRNWWADTSYDRFSQWVRYAVNDHAVSTILIDCDSPGGGVFGCADCADVVFAANKYKRVIACVNDLCASAALWIASAAREIVITQSGEIGSIGVMTLRIDITESLKRQGISVEVIRAGAQKAWGSPYLPMSDLERKSTQTDIDASYQSFINAVARNRQVSAAGVRQHWADARVFSALEAVQNGLVNRIASFDQVLSELVNSKKPAPAPTAAASGGHERVNLMRQWLVTTTDSSGKQTTRREYRPGGYIIQRRPKGPTSN